MLARCVAVIGLTLFVSTQAIAQTAVEKARLARTMWSAFQCGTFAEMDGGQKEQARLFDVGIKAGREFLDALQKKQIPPEVFSNEVPIGVSMILGGPTHDFVIGRVFEAAMRDAFDDIVKKENGLLLESSKWVNDTYLRRSKARTRYLKSNCVLVK